MSVAVAVGDALIRSPTNATPRSALGSSIRAIVYAAEVEAIRPVVAARLGRTIKAVWLCSPRRRGSALRSLTPRGRCRGRIRADARCLIAQAQADLADIHAPVLYLDDLLAKIAARKEQLKGRIARPTPSRCSMEGSTTG